MDVERLHRFLMEKDAGAAVRAVARLREVAALLARSAELGRPMDDGVARELVVLFGASSYVLRYRIAADGGVCVVRVWHSREGVAQ